MFLFLFLFLISLGTFGELPSVEELQNPKSNLATVVYSSDLQTLGKFYSENRENIRFEQLDKDIVEALVATEDARFYEHSGVDVMEWESFGAGWVTDIVKQLKLPNVNVIKADYGDIADFSKVNFDNDVVFTWNGTTSGVKVPNGDWIPANRAGLTFCDATSAVFAMDMPWDKLDVITYSWQKVLGGEGAHGMLILSPRAAERIEAYNPPWPMPKVFRMKSGGKLTEGLFKGETINTPSMLCVSDYLDALAWVDGLGGVKGSTGTIARSEANLAVLEDFVSKNDWISFLAKDKATRSNTSVCLTLKATEEQVKKLIKLLEAEGVGYDLGAYKDAPAGLRIWCGATVERADLQALLPWLTWGYTEVMQA